MTLYSLPYTVAISIRLWGVYRETAKANIQVKGSIVLVRTVSCLLFIALSRFRSIRF